MSDPWKGAMKLDSVTSSLNIINSIEYKGILKLP